jgi:hypothetical protein
MKYCKRCVIPDTRPGITFNEACICSACQSFENRKFTDYKARFEELKSLCNKYRGMNGSKGQSFPNLYYEGDVGNESLVGKCRG